MCQWWCGNDVFIAMSLKRTMNVTKDKDMRISHNIFENFKFIALFQSKKNILRVFIQSSIITLFHLEATLPSRIESHHLDMGTS